MRDRHTISWTMGVRNTSVEPCAGWSQDARHPNPQARAMDVQRLESDFFSHLESPRGFEVLFDYLPDVHFFV